VKPFPTRKISQARVLSLALAFEEHFDDPPKNMGAVLSIEEVKDAW
jgi:hypothetical protein